MKCPSCETTLHLTERQGIEIDYCPQCRGVWLDRGELDKIIDRVADERPASAPGSYLPPAPRTYEREYERHDDDDDRRYDDYRQPYGKRKRRGLLRELFDFD